jgi:D-glycero-D-manno-heptose 1,7-bisphosphate phosphatase
MPPSGDYIVTKGDALYGGKKRAVFFDRDGVLIRTDVRGGRPYAIRSCAEMEILAGAQEAVAIVRRLGFLAIGATNQPDVARGLVDRTEVDAMHDQITRELCLDEIQVCYEVESPESRRYKPRPGMLQDAAATHGIDLRRSYMVGDRWRDVDAGRAAGCFCIFIDCGYDEDLRQPPDVVVPDVLAAANAIAQREI